VDGYFFLTAFCIRRCRGLVARPNRIPEVIRDINFPSYMQNRLCFLGPLPNRLDVVFARNGYDVVDHGGVERPEKQ
jgi:hypothetical protein